MHLRDFKKEVEYTVGEFVEDCALFQTLNPDKAQDEVAEIVEDAVELYNSLKDRANLKVEEKKSSYFKKLRKEMVEKTDALYERLSTIVEKSHEGGKAAPKAEKPKAEAKPKEEKPKAEAKPKAAPKPKAEKAKPDKEEKAQPEDKAEKAKPEAEKAQPEDKAE
jgi:chemotaxis protein histidine kinase CheA